MWSGLSGLFGGMFGGSIQQSQLAQQNQANQAGSLGGIMPSGFTVQQIPTIPPPPTLAAYEEEVKTDIETTEEPDGSIVVKKGK